MLRAVLARAETLCIKIYREWCGISRPGLILVGKGQNIAWTAHLKITDRGRLELGPSVNLCRGSEVTVQRGRIEIGARTFVGPWSTIVAIESVVIGDDVLIAERVTIRDQDHSIHDGAELSDSGFKISPVTIGPGVWVGAGAVVLRGVSVGRGAVIAANAVVTRNVEEYEIVGGVPARPLGFRTIAGGAANK